MPVGSAFYITLYILSIHLLLKTTFSVDDLSEFYFSYDKHTHPHTHSLQSIQSFIRSESKTLLYN